MKRHGAVTPEERLRPSEEYEEEGGDSDRPPGWTFYSIWPHLTTPQSARERDSSARCATPLIGPQRSPYHR